MSPFRLLLRKPFTAFGVIGAAFALLCPGLWALCFDADAAAGWALHPSPPQPPMPPALVVDTATLPNVRTIL